MKGFIVLTGLGEGREGGRQADRPAGPAPAQGAGSEELQEVPFLWFKVEFMSKGRERVPCAFEGHWVAVGKQEGKGPGPAPLASPGPVLTVPVGCWAPGNYVSTMHATRRLAGGFPPCPVLRRPLSARGLSSQGLQACQGPTLLASLHPKCNLRSHSTRSHVGLGLHQMGLGTRFSP